MSNEGKTVIGQNIPVITGVKNFKIQLMLNILGRVNQVVFGDFGVGKTDIIRQLEDDKKKVINFDLAGVDAPDIMGICVPDREEKKAEYYKSFMVDQINKFASDPKNKDADTIIVFVDDITNIDKTCQASLFQLMNEQKINGYSLDDRCVIIAAGNHPDHSSVASELPKPLLNRCSVYTYAGPYVSEWLEYGQKNNAHPAVMAYINESLHDQTCIMAQKSEDDDQFLRPRSLEKVSKQLFVIEDFLGLDNGFFEPGKSNTISMVAENHIGSLIGQSSAARIAKTILLYGKIPSVTTIIAEKGKHNKKTEFDYTIQNHSYLLTYEIWKTISNMDFTDKNTLTRIKYLCDYIFNDNMSKESKTLILTNFLNEMNKTSDKNSLRGILWNNPDPDAKYVKTLITDLFTSTNNSAITISDIKEYMNLVD